MPVSIPWGFVDGLADHLRTTTQMNTQEASAAAMWIAQIAVSTAEDALEQGKSYSNSVSGRVRSDLTSSLNYLSSYLSDDIAIVREYVASSMLPALESIAAATGGVSDAEAEDIVKAYDAIADSQAAAVESVDKSIMTAAEQITLGYERAATFVNDGVMAAVAIAGDTVIEITSAIDRYTKNALDVLIPAEMQALRTAVDGVLEGKGMEHLLRLWAKRVGEEISEVFSFEEEEVIAWTVKMNKIIQDQMQAQLTP